MARGSSGPTGLTQELRGVVRRNSHRSPDRYWAPPRSCGSQPFRRRTALTQTLAGGGPPPQPDLRGRSGSLWSAGVAAANSIVPCDLVKPCSPHRRPTGAPRTTSSPLRTCPPARRFGASPAGLARPSSRSRPEGISCGISVRVLQYLVSSRRSPGVDG